VDTSVLENKEKTTSPTMSLDETARNGRSKERLSTGSERMCGKKSFKMTTRRENADLKVKVERGREKFFDQKNGK